MTDTRARAHAAETRVGDQRNCFAMRQIFQCRCELIGFLHARAHGTATDQSDDITGLDGILAQAFDRGNRGAFTGEDAGGSRFAIDAICIHNAWVNGCAFDDRSLWCEIAGEKSDRAGRVRARVLLLDS